MVTEAGRKIVGWPPVSLCFSDLPWRRRVYALSLKRDLFHVDSWKTRRETVAIAVRFKGAGLKGA